MVDSNRMSASNFRESPPNHTGLSSCCIVRVDLGNHRQLPSILHSVKKDSNFFVSYLLQWSTQSTCNRAVWFDKIIVTRVCHQRTVHIVVLAVLTLIDRIVNCLIQSSGFCIDQLGEEGRVHCWGGHLEAVPEIAIHHEVQVSTRHRLVFSITA